MAKTKIHELNKYRHDFSELRDCPQMSRDGGRIAPGCAGSWHQVP
jgi:hypothetical protein